MFLPVVLPSLGGGKVARFRNSALLSVLRRLLPTMLVALAIRMVVVVLYYRQLPDADLNYEQFGWEVGWVARSLASGHGFSSPYFPASGPTALIPPIHPFILAMLFRTFGVYSLTAGFLILTFNSICSALTSVAVYFSAQFSLGDRAARAAAWMWALYPFAIYFSAGRVWEYALTALLFTTCFCIAQRLPQWTGWPSWAGFGALYGVTALCNPSVISVLPFLLGYAAWRSRKTSHAFRNGLVALTALLLMLTPWTIRNYRVMHVLCPVRDNFWHEFYSGNNPEMKSFDEPSYPSTHPPDNPVEMKKFLSLGEVKYMEDKHHIAVDWVRQHPAYFIKGIIHRAVYYWTGYWDISMAYQQIDPTEIPNMFYVCCITLLMFRGLRRLWSSNQAAAIQYLLLLAFFPATYYLTRVMMDYRQPIEPEIIVLAIAGAMPFRRTRQFADAWSEKIVDAETLALGHV